jgi:hypothetical protein
VAEFVGFGAAGAVDTFLIFCDEKTYLDKT